MKKFIISALLMISSVFILSSCSIFNNEKVKEETVSIHKDQAKKLDVSLDLGAGVMNLSEGTKNWVDGTIEYNNKYFNPDVSYKLKDVTGKVRIEQSKKHFPKVKIGKLKNEWNLELSNKLPIDLDVNTGASKTNLDLRGLNLNKLEIEAGVGELNVNLGGSWNKSFEANIETGVGKTTIVLPSDVGVKINLNKGIGKANVVDLISKGNGVYVNEAYEKADVKLTINVDLGVGEVNFKLD
ncbi:toast rack family protein [Gottfriedia acidiceleris]|uniref:Toast rack family protein n=1 Tax=Gottfriedia acidiceleris TaxID=371036 RepID=A0ABY4JJ16_9BACI|nr:toast rack family protein [Gottfriedia acidiceleris]UPM53601.1 toast rack family protein [Gottfriedia acidiceleris]